MLGPQKISQTAVEEVLQELPKDDADDEDDIGFLECKGRWEWLTIWSCGIEKQGQPKHPTHSRGIRNPRCFKQLQVGEKNYEVFKQKTPKNHDS